MLKVPSLSMDKSHFEFREIDQVEWDIATGCRSHDEPEEEECVRLAGTTRERVKTQASVLIAMSVLAKAYEIPQNKASRIVSTPYATS